MQDAGNLHVLEAAFVAILLLTAMSFVLTFSLPTNPDDPVREDLERSSETSLGTFYDMPLSDPAYGNNTMSKALAEALRGKPGNLTDQLNATLPPGTAYNVYLNNGYGVLPVYETRDPQGQTITVSRPLEPRWTYTFLSTDVTKYPSAATGSPAKMTVYGLPVVKGMPIREGGVDVDVVVEGERTVPGVGTSNYELDATHAVLQTDRDDAQNPLPHVSMTFHADTDGADGDDEDGDGEDLDLAPVPSILHDDGGITSNETLRLRLEETAGQTVPAGTKLTITVPRGWNASAHNTTHWTVLNNATDWNRTDSLTLQLETPLESGIQDLTFHGTFHGDDYDYYTFRAELGTPVDGTTAKLLVKKASAGSTYKAEVPELLVSAPRFLGDRGQGTWALSVHNPPSVEGNAELTVDQVTVRQPEDLALFGPVTALDSNPCAGSWTRVNGSTLRWTPTSTCTLERHEVLNLTLKVESSGVGTGGAANVPIHPPAKYSDGYETTLRDPIAQGFFKWKVPPNDGSYEGWPNLAGSYGVSSRTSYNAIPIRGDTEYSTAGLTVFKDALALGRVHTSKGTVPVGDSVDIQTNVESLLLLLSDKGADPTIKTRLYAPWSMGRGVPFHTVDHTEQDLESKGGVVDLAHHDVTGDGIPDILVATDESRIHGLDGRDGVKISGMQRNYVGSTITLFQKHQFQASTTRFVSGFEHRTDGPELIVYQDDLTTRWTKNLASNVVSVVQVHDHTGDGVDDVAVGLSSGRAYVYDATDGTQVYERPGQDVAARLWHGSTMGFDEEPLTIRSTGTTVDPGVDTQTLDQSDTAMDQDGDSLGTGGSVTESLKSVSVSTASAGLEGYNTTNKVKYEYLGAAFDTMALGDLDGNSVTDAAGGRTSGFLSTLNGTQGNGEYAIYTIASGNTIVDAEALDEYWMATLSQDGILMWTQDAWATRNYYKSTLDENFYNFPYARGLDYVHENEGWVVWGLTGDTVSYTTDGGSTFDELTYSVEDRSGNPMNVTTDVAWTDIQWVGNDRVQGVLYGDDCRSKSLDLDGLTSALTCPDGIIAYNGVGDPMGTWHEANLPKANDRRVTDVHLYDGTNGVAVGENGGVWTTTDLTDWDWTGLTVSGTLQSDDLRAVHFFNDTHGFVAGDGGALFKTSDGGGTWTQVETPTVRNLHDITFLGTEKGWAVGNASTVIRTFDGGDSWASLDVPMAEDEADGTDYHSVQVPEAMSGWISGGSTGTSSTRTIGFLTSYVREATARSTSLTDHGSNAGIKNVTVLAELRLASASNYTLWISNDGCNSYQDATYRPDTVEGTLDLINGEAPVKVEFADPAHDRLCFRLDLGVGAYESHYWGPWLFNLTLRYNYTTTMDDPDWTETTKKVDLGDPSIIDRTATTARWDTSQSRIGLKLFDNFWSHILDGSVHDVAVLDMDGDGDNEVLAGTGDREGAAGKLSPNEDRRVYRLNGTTGVIDATSAKLPGPVVQLHTEQLANLTKDTVRDVLVVTSDPDTGTYKVTALDGTDLTELWSVSASVPINDVLTTNLDGDAYPETVLGTNLQESNGKSAEVRALHGDADPVEVMWRAYPDLKGRYSFTYNVPRYAVFGPYVVETEVQWKDVGATGVTQSARLYDYFIVTPESGEVPPSPLYNVELVVWYEDWG